MFVISEGPATKKLKQGVSNGVWVYYFFSLCIQLWVLVSPFFSDNPAGINLTTTNSLRTHYEPTTLDE